MPHENRVLNGLGLSGFTQPVACLNFLEGKASDVAVRYVLMISQKILVRGLISQQVESTTTM